MKKEYIKPEAEMLKFVETEEIMSQQSEWVDQFDAITGSTNMLDGWML